MSLKNKTFYDILVYIYQFTDIDTKINMNKSMNLRHNIKIPFKRKKIPYISKLLHERQYKYFTYYDKSYSKLYYKKPSVYSFVLPQTLQPSCFINLDRTSSYFLDYR